MNLEQMIIDDAARGVFRVHRDAFVDPRLFELERSRVLDHAWIYAAHESELPSHGRFLSRTVAGRRLILTRDAAGAVHALSNSCRHRGTVICREVAGSAKAFTCPYHNWTYDLRGALIGVPLDDAYEGTAFRREDHGLVRFRVDSYQGFIFVNPDGKAGSLPDFLGEAKEYLDLVAVQGADGMEIVPGSHQYSVAANWKLVAENGVDHYHFRVLHARYLDYLKGLLGAGAPGGAEAVQVGRDLGLGHGAHEHDRFAVYGKFAGTWGPLLPAALRPFIDAERERLEKRMGGERAGRVTRLSRNIRVFPNLCILDNATIAIRTFFPTAHDRVDAVEWCLAPKGEDPRVREARLRAHLSGPGTFVTPDDIEALELTQQGLGNPESEWLDYSRGMKTSEPLHTDERHHRGFFRHWHEQVSLNEVRHDART